MDTGQTFRADTDSDQLRALRPRSPSWFVYEPGFGRAESRSPPQGIGTDTIQTRIERSLSPSWFIYEPGFTRAFQAGQHGAGQVAMTPSSPASLGSSADAQPSPPSSLNPNGNGSRTSEPSEPGPDVVGYRDLPSPVYTPSFPMDLQGWASDDMLSDVSWFSYDSRAYDNSPIWSYDGRSQASPAPRGYNSSEEGLSVRCPSFCDSDLGPYMATHLPDPMPELEDVPSLVATQCLEATKEYLARERQQWLELFRPSHHDWEGDETMMSPRTPPRTVGDVDFYYTIGGKSITGLHNAGIYKPYLYYPIETDSVSHPPPEPSAGTDSFRDNLGAIIDLMWRRMTHRLYPYYCQPTDPVVLDHIQLIHVRACRAMLTQPFVERWLADGQLPDDNCPTFLVADALQLQLEAAAQICQLLGATERALMLVELVHRLCHLAEWIPEENREWNERYNKYGLTEWWAWLGTTKRGIWKGCGDAFKELGRADNGGLRDTGFLRGVV